MGRLQAMLIQSWGLRKLWRSRIKDETGATLVEMLMVMLILSILSAAAIPQLQKQSLRNKEYQLRRDLIRVRASIDQFHKDWREGLIAQNTGGISRDGYPTDWDILIEGVANAEGGGKRRYLRAIPENPFAEDPEEPWILMGHRDPPDSERWNGVDIFDLRANSERIALDGSEIRDW